MIKCIIKTSAHLWILKDLVSAGQGRKKDGPGPVMVSMHSRAKGTADHYWPWAVFFKILKFRQGSGPEEDYVL